MDIPTPKRMKQACDNCRRRKLKCNRHSPCDKCTNALLCCLYTDVLQRKGPKFRHFYPRASASPSGDEAQSPTSTGFATPPHSVAFGELEPSACSGSSTSFPPTSVLDPQEVGSAVGWPPLQGPVYAPQATARRLPDMVIIAHVNVYLKHLYPIMPVFDSERVLEDASQPDNLSPGRYAFLVALCAATHLQLRLDGPDPAMGFDDNSGAARDRPAGLLLSGDTLLAEAIRASKSFDMIDHPSVDNLLTSFFLFSCHGNLNKGDHAWFYLSQAVSMVYILKMNKESTYTRLDPIEAEEKRRIFWLLFVTERAYALQQSKPVTLRNSIRKPELYNSGDPILTYGFLNLVSLFEKLPAELYDWICSEDEQNHAAGIALTHSVQDSLCEPLLLEGVMETQQVDIRITQQWLRSVMWRVGIESSLERFIKTRALLPLNAPLTVGKSIMKTLSSASRSSIDAHGIGMEQKLFDIGSCVAQVARSVQPLPPTSMVSLVVDPRELLWGILSHLSNIRGSRSYLFSTLLENAGDVFNFEAPPVLDSLSPSLDCVPRSEDNYCQFASLPLEHLRDQPGESDEQTSTSIEQITSVPELPATTVPVTLGDHQIWPTNEWLAPVTR